MNWTKMYLSTLIPQMPKIFNDNFSSIENYLGVFYDGSLGVLIKPVNTTGRIKGTTGEFVNVITDNLTVKSQFTNWYSNYTTVDTAFTDKYNGSDVSTRVPSSYAGLTDASIWPIESSAYVWVDVNTPYIKINNDVSYGLQASTIGQEVQIIFDSSYNNASRDYAILLDTSFGGLSNLTVSIADVSNNYTWIKLIVADYDASYGPLWVIKQYGGNYTIS